MKDKRDIKNILFVCTGNSCRSVIAEALLKKILNDRGKEDIKVSSAGISAIGGFTPTENTIKVLKQQGIDASGYKTAKLTPDVIKSADLILAMENLHKAKVLTYVPDAKAKTYLLREYVNNKRFPVSLAIPDPIGLPLEVYERILGMIKEAIEKLARGL